MSIAGVEQAVAALGRWHPGDLAFIEEVRISGGLGHEKPLLELTALFQPRSLSSSGWPDFEAQFHRVVLKFDQVSDFVLRHPPSGQVTGFAIEDVRNSGMEKLNYRVEDYENGCIFFYCEKISLVMRGSTFLEARC